MQSKEEKNEYAKNWYKINRERLLEYNRKYREDNKEKTQDSKKKWYKENIDKSKNSVNIYREKNKDIIRNRNLIKNFGISLIDYNNLLLNQNNCCAICNINNSKLRRNLCVDHDHRTEEIRGLLCDTCNRGIGLLKDNVEVLKNAIEYLNNGRMLN